MLIVNLFGAPGAGKSTTRADVFRTLKGMNVNCEEVTEVAKKFTWEKRFTALKCQPYVFAKQLRDMEMLKGQVDVVITDSPILLSKFYGNKYATGDYPDSFYAFVVEQFNAMGGINFFINRTKKFNPAGRNQTEDESDQFATELKTLLAELCVPFTEVDGNPTAAPLIADMVMARLNAG